MNGPVNGDDTTAVPTWRVEALSHDLGVIADWLAHASEETLNELAGFTHCAGRWLVAELIDELGWHSLALRDLLTPIFTQRIRPQ